MQIVVYTHAHTQTHQKTFLLSRKVLYLFGKKGVAEEKRFYRPLLRIKSAGDVGRIQLCRITSNGYDNDEN